MEIIAVQDDDVGLFPFFERSDAIVYTEGFSWVDRGHGDDVGNGSPRIDKEVEDDFVHRRYAGSQGPVRKTRFPILYKHLLTAQTRFAVALEAGPHRIGDQDEAVAPFHLIGQFLSRRMDVEIITISSQQAFL